MPILSLLMRWGAQSALLALFSLFLVLVLSKSSGAIRNLIWRACLVGMVAIPAGMNTGFQIRLPVPDASAVTTSVIKSASVVFKPQLGRIADRSIALHSVEPAVEVRARHEVSGGTDEALRNAERPSSQPWTILLAVYLAGVAAVMCRWGTSLIRVISICGSSTPVEGTSNVFIAQSPQIRVPFTLGWRRPLIVLPAEAVFWTESRMTAVILHEESHLKRNDWIWQTSATLYSAIHWFNPASWLVASQLRATAEETADNAVLGAGIMPSAYVTDIIAIAQTRHASPAAAMGMTNNRRIKSRLKAILDQSRDRRPASRRTVFAIALGFSVLSACLAGNPNHTAHGISRRGPEPRSFSGVDLIPLKNGSKLRVVYVESGPTSDHHRWNADGSTPANPEPHGQTEVHGAMPSKDGTRYLTVCCELTDIPQAFQYQAGSPGIAHPLRLPGLSDSGSGIGGGGPSMVYHSSFIVPESWKTTELEFDYPVGDFHQVAENSHTKHEIQASVSLQQVIGHSSDGKDKPFKEVQLRWADISFVLPNKAKPTQWKLAAFDRNGKELPLTSIMPSYNELEAKDVWHAYVRADPNDIGKIVISVRDLQKAKIGRLHLYPDNEATR